MILSDVWRLVQSQRLTERYTVHAAILMLRTNASHFMVGSMLLPTCFIAQCNGNKQKLISQLSKLNLILKGNARVTTA